MIKNTIIIILTISTIILASAFAADVITDQDKTRFLTQTLEKLCEQTGGKYNVHLTTVVDNNIIVKCLDPDKIGAYNQTKTTFKFPIK